MKRAAILLIFILCSFLCQILQVEARMVYVNPRGNDSNRGTNNTTDAIKTIYKAVEIAKDGDIIQLDEGTYTINRELYISEKLQIRGSGTKTTVIKVTSPSGIVCARDSVLIGDGNPQNTKDLGIKFQMGDSCGRAIYIFTTPQYKSIRGVKIYRCVFEGGKLSPPNFNGMVDGYGGAIEIGSNTGDTLSGIEIRKCTFQNMGKGGKSVDVQGQQIRYAAAGIIISNIGNNKEVINPGDGILIHENTFLNLHSGSLVDQNRPLPAIGVLSIFSLTTFNKGVLIKNNTYENTIPNNQFIGVVGGGMSSLVQENTDKFTGMTAMGLSLMDLLEMKFTRHITVDKIDIMKVMGIDPKETGGVKIGGTLYFDNADSAQVNAERFANVMFSPGTFPSFSTLPYKPLQFIGAGAKKTFISISNKSSGVKIQTDTVSFQGFGFVGTKDLNGTGIVIDQKSLAITKLTLKDLRFQSTTNGIIATNLQISNASFSNMSFNAVSGDAISLRARLIENVIVSFDTITGGSQTGITATRSENLRIEKNQINMVSNYAIWTEDMGGTKGTISGNQIAKATHGIFVIRASDILIADNLVAQPGQTIKTVTYPGLGMHLNGINITAERNTVTTPFNSKDQKDTKDLCGIYVKGTNWTMKDNVVVGCSTASKLAEGYGIIGSGYGTLIGNKITGAEYAIFITSGTTLPFNISSPVTLTQESASLIKLGSNTLTTSTFQDLVTSGNSNIELINNITLNSADIQGGLFRFGIFNVSVQKAFSLSSKGNLDYLGTGSIQPSAMAVLSNTTGNLDIQWPLLLAKGKTTFALKHGNYSYKISSNTARTISAIDVLWDITMAGSSTGLLRVSVEGTKFFLPAFNQSKAKFAEVVTTGKFKSLENPGIMNQNSGYYVKEIALKNSGKFFISSEQFTSIEDDYVDTKNYLTWYQSNSELEIRIKDQHIQEIQSLELVDLQGRTLYTDIPTSDIHRIHTSGYAAGIYLLRVTRNDGEHIVTKIILQ